MSDNTKTKMTMTAEQAAAARGEFWNKDDHLEFKDGIGVRAALKQAGYEADSDQRQILRVLERDLVENTIQSRCTSDLKLEARYRAEKGDIVLAMTNFIAQSYTKDTKPIGRHASSLLVFDFVDNVEKMVSKHAPRQSRTAA